MSVLDRFRLDGKVAVVTGASSGLGAAFAVGLADAGADVAICARRTDRLQQTKADVEALGRRCIAVTADVANPDDCHRVAQETKDALGRLDILVNNAGIGTAYPATKETPEQFRQVIDINLNGSYWMAQACVRHMQPGASIVNIGSVLGWTTAGPPQAAYGSSKAAIIGLTRDLAAAVDGPQGRPGERARARFLPLGDDRDLSRGLHRVPDAAGPGGPQGRTGGARDRADLPRQ